jgi:biotin carboxyl carrier protein
VATSENTEERLRAEIEALKRQLEERHAGHASGRRRKPGAKTLLVLAVLAVVALVSAFFLGYLPESTRQTALAKEAQESGVALPRVNVAIVQRSPGKSELVLPGSIQAVTEAPILARASGYIGKRYADIGDRVKEGDLLAEIDAPSSVSRCARPKPASIRHPPRSSRPTPICSRARPTPKWPASRPSAGAVSC